MRSQMGSGDGAAPNFWALKTSEARRLASWNTEYMAWEYFTEIDALSIKDN